ncbi:alpha/beta hydrolase [Microbacterium invictum]|uniref:Enterochelin esterase-like enzyme n=1 Tax=Microbacterium invictum TaxID=515415 RepID=A0AA40VMV3_9MICO|nr:MULTISPECIES: alpha/beta hydrolase-fold protein [Microbacterium]MBB4140819.1 enterochelin esterase-like enzyme [Microbacterium invictum]
MSIPLRAHRRARVAIASTAAVLLAAAVAPAAAYAEEDAASGTLTHVTYFSDTLQREEGAWVYVPPQYDGEHALPTTYVSPGGCRGEGYWLEPAGPAITLEDLDAVFSDGAVPQVLVMVNGAVGSNLLGSPLEDIYGRVVVDDLIPYMEANFDVKTDGASRAIAGNSCGGVQALNTFLTYPTEFSQLGMWSTGWFPATRALIDSDPAIQAKITSPEFVGRVSYVEARDGADDNLAGPNLLATAELLAKYGVETQKYVRFPGVGHDDVAGRLALLQGLGSFFQGAGSGIDVKAEIAEGEAGALTLTIGANDGVTLSGGNAGDRLRLDGVLPTVTVSDSRNAIQAAGGGWAVSGRASNLASSEGQLSAAHLGWTPRALNTKPGVETGATTPTAIDGGSGLSTSSRLAEAGNASRTGSAVLSADVFLEAPVDTAGGTYTSKITLSLFPVD